METLQYYDIFHLEDALYRKASFHYTHVLFLFAMCKLSVTGFDSFTCIRKRVPGPSSIRDPNPKNIA